MFFLFKLFRKMNNTPHTIEEKPQPVGAEEVTPPAETITPETETNDTPAETVAPADTEEAQPAEPSEMAAEKPTADTLTPVQDSEKDPAVDSPEAPQNPAEATEPQPSEPANEPQELPQPEPLTVDFSPVLNALSAVDTQLKNLSDDFARKLKYDASKQEIIDRQHAELERYRREEAAKQTRAIVMDLIAEIDGAERSSEHFATAEATPENYAKLRKLVCGYAEDLRDLLENHDVIAYRSEPGTLFNGKRHSALKTIPTDNPELAKTIQSSIRWGFEMNDKVIRLEKVAVYVLQKPTEPAE